jgi:hypothetical protein
MWKKAPSGEAGASRQPTFPSRSWGTRGNFQNLSSAEKVFGFNAMRLTADAAKIIM